MTVCPYTQVVVLTLVCPLYKSVCIICIQEFVLCAQVILFNPLPDNKTSPN